MEAFVQLRPAGVGGGSRLGDELDVHFRELTSMKAADGGTGPSQMAKKCVLAWKLLHVLLPLSRHRRVNTRMIRGPRAIFLNT